MSNCISAPKNLVDNDYFEKAYNYILRDNDVPPTARLLYLTLSSYAKDDSCFVSIRRLAKDLGRCLETVRKYLRWLKEHGFIEIEHRRKANSFEYDTNIYTLIRGRKPWDYYREHKKTDSKGPVVNAASLPTTATGMEDVKSGAGAEECEALEKISMQQIENRYSTGLKCLKYAKTTPDYIELLLSVLEENVNLTTEKQINKVLYTPREIRQKLINLTDFELVESVNALKEIVYKQKITNPRNYLLSILMRAHGDSGIKHFTNNTPRYL